MQAKASQNKQYSYLVGIDFGTYSTSFSFTHISNKNDIQTITDWGTADNNSFPERAPSSIIYKQEDSVPLWGCSAHKRFYNERDDFFYAPHIKLYLTDTENQIDLPGKLTPVKLVSDYLRQLHEYGIHQMKTYFQKINKEREIESVRVADHGISSNEESNEPIFNVTEDQIRYVFSYPDNPDIERDRAYKMQVREALELAGIISVEDPEYRLKFIAGSEATANFCLNILGQRLKPSSKPYLVCDVGEEILGFSTIQAEEAIEPGTIISHVDLAIVGCGSLEIDKNMGKYLEDKITASPEDNALLDRARRELFDFYLDEIKTSFTDDPSGKSDYYHDMVGISKSSINSALLNGDTFVFSYNDMKSKIFDPVTDKILENIENVIKKFDKRIGGIFLSGTIGEHRYLSNLVKDRFQTANLWVSSIGNSAFAVSEGLIYSGIRERGLMVPYFENREVKQKQRVLSVGNEKPGSGSHGFSGLQKINHKDIDYIICLDFGTTYSGFAYAPVPKTEEEEKKSHTQVIKEIKAWPKQTGGNYPKVPSMLYYNQKMEYHNKFGYEAKNESTRAKAAGVLLRHFKLLLSRDFNPDVDDKILKKLDDFNIVGAITNFLKDFNKEGITRMKRAGLKVDEDRLGYIVTIPAMWSDEAKNTMKEAVRRANLFKSKKGENILDDRLAFITEAEAATLYCEKYYKDEFSMDRQQRFMICDAGGGTVDVVTFEVGQEEGPDGKLLISELTSGDGENCGSVYLDDNFKDYILKKFNKLAINYSEKCIENLVDQFIKEIKPNFEPSLDPDMEKDIRFEIPISLGLPTYFEQDDEETQFIQDNEILIPYSDMEKIVFTPVVDKVLQLIGKQLQKLPEGERQLDSILVVGGFGQSAYLHQKIKERFENKAVGAVFIGRPPDGHLAVCRGAVSFGLEPRMIPEGIIRQTYGLQVKDVCRESDDLQQRIIGYDDRIYCQNVLSEIVAKETKINKGVVYVMKTFVIFPKEPVFAIYAIEDDKDLRTAITTANISPVRQLTAKIPEIPGIKEGDKVEFEVVVEIAGTNINVDILCQGKLLTENVETKANTVISRNKYELSSKNEKKKGRSGIQIFTTSR